MKYRNELRKWRIRGMRRQQWRTGFELCARQILCICDRVYLKLATMSTNHWTQLGLWQSWLCLLYIYHHPPFIHPLNKLSQCKSVIGMVAWSVVLSRSFYRDSIHPPMGHGQTERQADKERPVQLWASAKRIVGLVSFLTGFAPLSGRHSVQPWM